MKFLRLLCIIGLSVALFQETTARKPVDEPIIIPELESTEFYLFVNSWLPDFCQSKKNNGACRTPIPEWKQHATIHGLWPEYQGSKFPQFCDISHTDGYDYSSATSLVKVDDLYAYWPNVQSTLPYNSPEYSSFWKYEWNKHGTCSESAQDKYFDAALTVAKTLGTASAILNNVGQTANVDAVVAEYGGADMVALKCFNNSLSEIYTCWSKNNENGSVIGRMACPANILNRFHTCQGDFTVRDFAFDTITSPFASSSPTTTNNGEEEEL